MAKRESVSVWYDRPGNFLEIFWGYDDGSGNNFDMDTELEPTIFLDSANLIAGFHIIGAFQDSKNPVEETYTPEDNLSHPVTVKYSPVMDQWDVQWGPDVTDCVETPNSHVKARVDAQGQIQGVLISGLSSFEDEILNVDLYPVTPGAATA